MIAITIALSLATACALAIACTPARSRNSSSIPWATALPLHLAMHICPICNMAFYIKEHITQPQSFKALACALALAFSRALALALAVATIARTSFSQ